MESRDRKRCPGIYSQISLISLHPLYRSTLLTNTCLISSDDGSSMSEGSQEKGEYGGGDLYHDWGYRVDYLNASAVEVGRCLKECDVETQISRFSNCYDDVYEN